MMAPSAPGGGSDPVVAVAVRTHEDIVADCRVVALRLKAERDVFRLEKVATPAEFNRVAGAICRDARQLDELLGELYDEMCWHKPELLGVTG